MQNSEFEDAARLACSPVWGFVVYTHHSFQIDGPFQGAHAGYVLKIYVFSYQWLVSSWYLTTTAVSPAISANNS